jgi:hypothetical protein
MPAFPIQHPRRQSAARLAALVVLVVCASALLLVPTASAADFTWSGGGGSGADAWSNTANWVGGSAPAASSSIGNLTFPMLAGPSVSHNDLSGLSVNHLSINDSNAYAINGEGFALGGGGLEVAEPLSGAHDVEIYAPIDLVGDQTWDLSGGGEGSGQTVTTLGALSGDTSSLAVNLQTADAGFSLGRTDTTPDNELGNVTVVGVSSKTDNFFLESALNVTDGNTLTVENVSFGIGTHGSSGPVVGINAALELAGSIGALTSTSSHLHVPGVLRLPSASFDSGSAVEFGIGGPGIEAGSDFTQLNATGSVSLGGSTLELNGLGATIQFGTCAPPTGQVYTIVSTTGTISGTFGNAPNGGVISASECLNLGPHGEVISDAKPSFRINYNTTSSPETVTATATEEAPSTGGGESSGGGGTGGSSGTSSSSTGGSSTSSSGGSTATATISSAQLTASLVGQLIPTGKATTIAALLKAGGLTMPFTALEAGTLVVEWYAVPAGSTLAKHSEAKPVLVASGQMTFSAAGTRKITIRLTAAGRKLLKHSKRIRLEAKGVFRSSNAVGVATTKSFRLSK